MKNKTDYDFCLSQLEKITADRKNCDLNEAQTRFDIIDNLLIECLSWDREQIKVEEPHGPDFADYVLGMPRRMIVEAKRTGVHFDIPAENSRLTQSLRQIAALSKNNKSALEQVQGYCAKRGVRYAVICNGWQLIAFVATRQDGVDPLEGKCLAINSNEHLLANFARVHSLLSSSAIESNKLALYLKQGEAIGIPRKLSSFLATYPNVRMRTDFQANLKIVSDLVLEDVLEDESVEKRFYEECYCEAGALSQHAMVSKKILAARYAALFNPSEATPTLSPIGKKKSSVNLTDEVMALAASKRPIVLIGDVGVGKTSFIKHLLYVSAKEEFKDSLFIYVDLGKQGTLSTDIREVVLDQLDEQLTGKHGVDIRAANFVTGVYHAEVARFRKSMDGELEESNPELYKERLREHLKAKVNNRSEHIRRAISHLSAARRAQVIIAIDNADQRNVTIQQEAFVIAQEVASNWGAVVFIAVRPHTFYQSKRAGALSAYPTKAFTISPPRIDAVLDKRLTFALDMATGRIAIDKLHGVSFNMTSLAYFLSSLLTSLRSSDGLVTLIDNISGGNVRTSVELVTKYIGSPNADTERIVQEVEARKSYIIPVHDFARSIMYGEYWQYVAHASLAFNLFDVELPDPREHFLSSLIIAFLRSDKSKSDHEGFVSAAKIFSEMQSLGFGETQLEKKLRQLTNKKLIETSERITFEEDITGLIGNMPSSFRITTAGAYHVNLWGADFSYLDAMITDTPIFSEESRKYIQARLHSYDLENRHDRASMFRDYLTEVWADSDFQQDYFNWQESISACQASFDRVSAYLDRLRLNSGK